MCSIELALPVMADHKEEGMMGRLVRRRALSVVYRPASGVNPLCNQVVNQASGD